ncbi:hypothetical protein O5D80_8742 [Batrachochytrium dendrobatidis]|nr:hypothetical protein O5D80_8742 [Batrachochytrium dendrobatidis]
MTDYGTKQRTVMCGSVGVARGMLDKDVDVVVPSGETGSFTQMPSTPPLYSHQPAKPTQHAKSVQCKTPSRSYSLVSSVSPSSIVIPVSLVLPSGRFVSCHSLVDSGASGNFIDESFIARSRIPLVTKQEPLHVEGVDGRPLSSGPISKETLPLRVVIGDFIQEMTFDVIKCPHQPLIFGYPWLSSCNPKISWFSRVMKLPHSVSCLVSNSSSKINPVSSENSVSYRSFPVNPVSVDDSHFIEPPVNDSCFVLPTSDVPSIQATTTPSSDIPLHLVEFASVFSKKKALVLPPHRQYDCPIDLEPGSTPKFGPLYSLSEPELKALRDYLDENLANGFIQPSTSPAGSPILFVKKKDGSLRLCVDYRSINNITIKNRYPLPLINEMLDRLQGSQVYTKLDLRGAYNLLRIRAGDEWKTAFRTRYGHFEYKVMPFGLTNAPATFQHFINDVLRNELDQFAIAYLDDILIYSKSEKEHLDHVRTVLKRLHESQLYCKLEKCEFSKDRISFLGYVISPKGIEMEREKLTAVLDWPQPKSLTDLRSFIGFANFYRRFIDGYSKIAAPLTQLFKKSKVFEWTPDANNAFQMLKNAFVSDPTLVHADTTRPFIIESDASDFAIGCVLSQRDANNQLRPCSFHSRSLSSAERNYSIYEKELLAIREAFDVWRHYLEGAHHAVEVLTDHKNLEYLASARILNQRHARWSEFLSRFNIKIQYRPGSKNGKADALSRRSDYETQSGDIPDIPRTLLSAESFSETIDTPHHPSSVALQILPRTTTKDLLQLIQQSQQTDDYIMSLGTDPEFVVKEGLLLHQDRIVVPKSCYAAVLHSCHDVLAVGHPGIRRTLNLVSRKFWWPTMRADTKNYVSTCDTCARAKVPRHKPYGLLKPLETSDRPWGIITMDFISSLPTSNGHTCIFVIVCSLTKLAHFVSCPELPSADETATMFIENVFRLHGLPDSIVSDRGPQFTSHFWQALCKGLGIRTRLSTAFHPQTDGQTERVNQVINQYLRCYTSYQQDDWVSLLPLAEFAYNNLEHASIRSSPFLATYGYHPRIEFPTLLESSINVPSAQERIQHIQQNLALLKENLEKAKSDYKHFSDRNKVAEPVFTPGELVWLLARNIKTTRPSKKLDYQRLGPFRVIEPIGTLAYRLELPKDIRIHPVFHVSLLEKHQQNEFADRQIIPPPPVIVENHLEYEVEKILDSKIVKGQLHYLVDWKGYTINDRSWEPVENISAPDKLAEFHSANPSKPKEPSRLQRRRRLERG